MENNLWLNVLKIITPVFLLLLAGIGWLYKHEKEKRREIENTLSNKKYDTYIYVIDILFKMILNVKTSKKQPDYTKEATEMNKKLFVYSSDTVFKKFLRWTQAARKGKNNLTHLADFLVEIRKDMGHKKTTITSEDFLNQLLLDYDDAREKGLIE